MCALRIFPLEMQLCYGLFFFFFFPQTKPFLWLWKIPFPLSNSLYSQLAPLGAFSATLRLPVFLRGPAVHIDTTSGRVGIRFGKIFPVLEKEGEGPLLSYLPSPSGGPRQQRVRCPGPPRDGRTEGWHP